MKQLETRYPCPVCLGVKMEKVTLGTESSTVSRGASHASDSLTLDHCRRCGGVWFEAGEVQLLRRIDATELWRAIVQRDGIHSMQCHSCRTYIPRTAGECHLCGWRVELDCPVCDRPMRMSAQDGLRLDYCTHCRGVWFDHDELTGIWKMEVDALVKRGGARTVDGAGDIMLLDVLLYDPFVMYYGIHAAGHAAGGAAEAIAASGSIEVVGEVAGAAGEVASSLFETIVGIIGGIFG
jgi:Zn-finger nucleic acid-binding protein